MLEKIKKFSEKYNMFHPGDTVLCGLSGGADSVCMIICLSELSSQLGIRIEAIHVNHCLRGEESDRDENFCRELCRKLGIKFIAVSCNVRAYADENSLSEEEAARKLRYEAFAEHSHGKIIATAHSANDNLETVIFNLARGTASKGLAGIPPVRDNIVRPMLAVCRNEIEEFLKQHRFSHITDSSNLSDNYTRNKIRHNIIPIFSEINESVIETSIKSIDAVRAESSFIDEEAERIYNECFSDNTLTGISKYHVVLRRRCIARMLAENSLPYSYERLTAADNIAINSGKIDVSGDLYLISDGKSLALKKITKKPENKLITANMIIGDNQIFKNKILNAELICSNDLKVSEIVNKKLATYFLDYDKIIGNITVRSRRFGDKIRLRGRNVTSSVKKLINETIPPEQRGELHFLEDEAGTILGEKIGIADRISPDEKTINYLKITVRSIDPTS